MKQYTSNPGGTGVKVTDYVDYSNFLTASNYTLQINSLCPHSNVSVTSNVFDNDGKKSGVTPFTLMYDSNSNVILTAPSTVAGAAFDSWTDCDSPSGYTCTVTMNTNRIVTVKYRSISLLNVNSTNPNSGVVITLNPPDENTKTGGTTPFSLTYLCLNDPTVTLTAPASAGGNIFKSWTGCDSPSGRTCTTKIGKTVTVNYKPKYTLTVSKPGTGSGTVTSVPAGINCGTACSKDFFQNTAVTLTANADEGSTFSGWSGACNGIGECKVTMDGNKSAIGSFTLPVTIDYTITIQWRDDSSNGVIGDGIGEYKPLRFAKVELYDQDDLIDDPIGLGSHDYLGSGVLDSNGTYTFTNIQSDDPGGPDLYVKIILESDVVSFNDFGQPDMFTLVDKNVTQNLTTIARMDQTEQSQHAHIFETVHTLNKYFRDLSNNFLLPKVRVNVFENWYNKDETTGFYHGHSIFGDFNHITIDSEHDWNRFAIAHEYSHFIMFNAYGSRMPATSITDPDHHIFSERDSGFALKEGWAEFMENWFYPSDASETYFFSVVGYQNTNIGYYSSCDSVTDWSGNYTFCRHQGSTIETNSWWQGEDYQSTSYPTNPNGNSGVIVEGAVASILWDIFDSDDSDEQLGGIADGFNKIWNVILSKPNNILVFYNKFISKYPSDELALASIYSMNGIPLLTAKATSSSSVVLAWNDNSTDETGFKIERKAGTCVSSNPWSQIDTTVANATTYTDTGLAPATTYCYRIRAYNTTRNFSYSNLASTKTGVAGCPNSPITFRATSTSSNKIILLWDDKSMDETTFKIYRKIDAGLWKLLFTTGPDEESYDDLSASENNSTTTYSYYVKACKGSLCSPNSNIAVVPYKPTGLSATAFSSSQINLEWNDNSPNETGFQVYRKTGTCSSADPWRLIASLGVDSPQYFDTGLSSGTTYSYRVRTYIRPPIRPYASGYSLWSNNDSNCVSATTP